MNTFSVLGADAGIPGDAVGTVPRSANRFSSQVLGCCCTSQARADTDTTRAATSLRASTKRVTCNIIFKSSGFGQEHSSETFTAEGGQRIGRVEGREFGIGVDNGGRDCHLPTQQPPSRANKVEALECMGSLARNSVSTTVGDVAFHLGRTQENRTLEILLWLPLSVRSGPVRSGPPVCLSVCLSVCLCL